VILRLRLYDAFVGQELQNPSSAEEANMTQLTHQANERIVVQFCPCGCVTEMTVAEFVELDGDRVQLDRIERGEKLDAPILPTAVCSDCQDEAARQDRLTAEMLSDLDFPSC
jgi:hypothetical protein